MIIGVLGFCCILQPKSSVENTHVDHDTDQRTFAELLKSTGKLMVSKKMMLMNGQMFWSGISIAIYGGLLTPILVLELKDTDLDDNHKTAKALIGMTTFGAGQFSSALIMGVVNDKLGSKTTCFLNCIFVAACGGMVIYSLTRLEYDYVSFLMCYLWGF